MRTQADFALVRCAGCGEYYPVPWEFLGDTRPDDVSDFRCCDCEPDGVFYERDDAARRDFERAAYERCDAEDREEMSRE